MFTKKNLLMLVGRHSLVALVAVGISVGGVFFFAKEIERVSNTVIKNRDLATALERRTELFATIKRDVAIVGANDARIEHSFLRADNILEFVSVLESIALKNGISQSFSFSDPSPAVSAAPFSLSTITYTNNISSDALAFSNYLKDFERLPYFTKIESLSISSQGPSGWKGMSSISFHATLYTKAVQ